MIENTCVHIWHTSGREKAWDGTRGRVVPRVNSIVVVRRGGSTISSISGSKGPLSGAESSGAGSSSAGSSSAGSNGAGSSAAETNDAESSAGASY